jgi:hypothetical protein
MKRFSVLMSLAVLAGLVPGATVSSPDGDITATVSVAQIDGLKDCLTWRVTYKGKPIIVDSPLTFELKGLPALAQVPQLRGENVVSGVETPKVFTTSASRRLG